jgi:hypothetical protein
LIASSGSRRCNSYAIGGQANNSTCNAASYYAVTAGLKWKATKWVNFRPYVHYDWKLPVVGNTVPSVTLSRINFCFQPTSQAISN